jgi:hypothetical protein
MLPDEELSAELDTDLDPTPKFTPDDTNNKNGVQTTSVMVTKRARVKAIIMAMPLIAMATMPIIIAMATVVTTATAMVITMCIYFIQYQC